MMVRNLKFSLTVFAVLICCRFFYILQNHGQKHHRSRKTRETLSPAECFHLKSFILNSTMIKLDWYFWGKYLRTFNALRGCPWIENQTEHNLLQSKLKKCCNASYAMIVTQENTPMGHRIHYDGQKAVQNVTESLYKLFPKDSPIQKPIRSCAVVGNGGILKNSFCGAEIDQADFVFRMNLPPLNDVGTKTDLISVNPSILNDKFGGLRENRKPFINTMQVYGSAIILLPAFSLLMNTDVSLRTLYTLEDFNISNKVVFFNPQYLVNLTLYWKNMEVKSNHMSTGLILVSAAIEVCEKVTLFGFWPFSQGLYGTSIPHHYYDTVPPKRGIHSMFDEFYLYLQMHSQGALQLILGPCNANNV